MIVLVLHDAFETMLLPRRISRQFRFARFFFRSSWRLWAGMARRIRSAKRRNAFLSQFGPLSFLVLISLWASGLIVGFACSALGDGHAAAAAGGVDGLDVYLYMSGVIFFTLGFGDVTPAYPLGRFVAVVEAGLGFAFLAVVISYLPVLYQAFSHREVTISLLDARAGSPPSAGQLLIRFSRYRNFAAFDRFLEEWEAWAAEVLESHVSFPLSELLPFAARQPVVAGGDDRDSGRIGPGDRQRQGKRFLPGPVDVRHGPACGRGPGADLSRSARSSRPRTGCRPTSCGNCEPSSGTRVPTCARASPSIAKLAELRQMYEPFVNALSELFHPRLATRGSRVGSGRQLADQCLDAAHQRHRQPHAD